MGKEREEVLTIRISTEEALRLENPQGDSVVMIPFRGQAAGPYFEGEVLPGGVDTQIIGQPGNRHTLSARYMLQGTDRAGQRCELYIENNGSFGGVPEAEGLLFRTTPKIITNSETLSFLNGARLVGEGRPSEDGVEIRIYRLEA
ncbi:DUF3237 domain-containing protein [Saccharibacillus brassicae]|uniref:DUF3237 domain-containing protein n=1 Tax=Saccharibacillus brassicae TaxID=2583377 RepID=A0A4Y6UX62_SACBS|nr:DUF3237 domain-containing protein [Saccharibacillus brassicae]QDH21190.1 DUF3237 domain-containing protein [Saccharibacillus brassicae]